MIPIAQLPPDDLNRRLTVAQIDDDASLPHIGMVGDTYTTTVSGEDTAGRFSVIAMHIPPGGGPGPHRHDFEETFILLEGEVKVTFRGESAVFRAGTTINIPANAPHRFYNASSVAARLLCICSPAGNEKFFEELGVRVATRTTPPAPLDEQGEVEFKKKAQELAPKYHTELTKSA